MTESGNTGYTPQRHQLGLEKEEEFDLLMQYHKLRLERLSTNDPYCSVDFVKPHTNTHIELTSGKIKKGKIINIFFENTKISRWKRNYQRNLYVYMAFRFIDKQYCFIKCKEDLFGSFKTS